jgi:hypothetical protein
MPSYIVRNQNFRDEVLKFSYPFDERSLLESEELFIGTDLFLDAIIYLKEPAELPLHIREVDGTYGALEEVLFRIADNNGKEVATSVLTYGVCTSDILSTKGVSVGTFVFDIDGAQRFISNVAGTLISLQSDVAAFSPDVTHVSKTAHLRYVSTDTTHASGTINIIARHGVKFDSNAGVLQLGVVGDNTSVLFETTPVISVNGVRNQSIWLAAHPRANLRLSTKDNAITFIAAKDTPN